MVAMALAACGGGAPTHRPPTQTTSSFIVTFDMRRDQYQKLTALAQNPNGTILTASDFIWNSTCGSTTFQQPTMSVVQQTRFIVTIRVTFATPTANSFRNVLASDHCRTRSIRRAFLDTVDPIHLNALIKSVEASLVPNLGYARVDVENTLDAVSRPIRWRSGHPTNYGAKVLGTGGVCDFEIDGPASSAREVSVTCLYRSGESVPVVVESIHYLKAPLTLTSGAPAINWFDSQFQRVINIALSGSSANLTAHYSDGVYDVEFAYVASIGSVSVFETPVGLAP